MSESGRVPGLFPFLKRLILSVSRGWRKRTELEKRIDYTFKDKRLLKLALTHRSALAPDDSFAELSNERLEFLGDAVLEIVVCEFLYHAFPESREGDLTKIKSSLVNETTLSKVASRLSIDREIRMSHDEERSGGRFKSSILSDACESLLGAVYLDGGLKEARHVVQRHILSQFDSVLDDDSTRNFKGELLERLQAMGKNPPGYEVIKETGPDHNKVFHIAVIIDGKRYGHGVGYSKKQAEQQAAKQALERLGEITGPLER